MRLRASLPIVLLTIACGLSLTVPSAGAGTFPGANGRIAFSDSSDVQTILPDGSGLQNLTSSPGVYDGEPAWSPDGRKIAYISAQGESGNNDIWTMDADGSNKTQLTDTADAKTAPTWTADGTKIVYSSKVGTQAGLFSVPAAGGAIALYRPVNPAITTLPGIGNAQLNLLGQLLWTERFEHQPSSFVDALWTAEGNLTGDDGIFAKQGAWSPDGRSITYISCIPEDCRISGHVFRANSDGSEPQNLTPTTMSINSPRQGPVFSPDGKQIAFRQGSGIRIIDAILGGSGVFLTLGRDPDWQPLVGVQPGGGDGTTGGGTGGDGGPADPGAADPSAACTQARAGLRKARKGAKKTRQAKARSARRAKVAAKAVRKAKGKRARTRAKTRLAKSRKQAKRANRRAKQAAARAKRSRNRVSKAC